MTNSKSIRVIFFPVRSGKEKQKILVETAYHHFIKKEHILMIAEEDKALAYIDELLWNFPENSFLPHEIITLSSKELVAITKVKKNLNNARFIFNLCPTPLLIEDCHQVIYEWEDFTSPIKQTLSERRFQAYKDAHYPIESQLSS